MKTFSVSPKWIVLTGLLLGPLPPALAERAIDESRPATGDGRVEIENVSGSIEVVGWDKDEVRVSGTVADDVEKVAIATSGKVIEISVILPRNSHHGSANLRIEVPRSSGVSVETVSADITLSELSGEIEAESVSGGIRVGGSITEIEAESVSGDIEVRSTATLDRGEFETVSGDLELSGALSASGRFSFESVSGDVVLDLPSGAGADLEVESFSGSIRGDVPSNERRSGSPGRGSAVEFSVGAGGGRVRVQTFSGDVEVRTGGK